jgi:predicted metal-dependent phosphoesterase TrpH
MIDLHVHTTMSDGTLSPAEVVRHAQARGLRAIAVTDHDTTAGIAPAQIEGAQNGLEVIPGVEISSQWPEGILHILGYFIRQDDPNLLACLSWLSNGRRERIPLILDKLRANGVNITEQDVDEETVGGVPGRPHVANVMVRKGYVHTLQDAFDRYLKKGAPAYVVKTKLDPEKAIQAIAKAGGLPVLAHPYSLRQSDATKLADIVSQLMAYGLRGIEAYYSKHTREQTDTYLAVASKFGLVVTGGSDFHGANKPDVEMGVIPAAGDLPYRIVENLKSAAKHQPLSAKMGPLRGSLASPCGGPA